MSNIYLTIMLALAWVALTGDFSAGNLFAGVILSYGCLWLTQSFTPSHHHFNRKSRYSPLTKAWQMITFALFFLWELTLANLQVAAETISFQPMATLKPGIVAVPLDLPNEAAITFMANFITLTPGTLSVDVSADQTVLYVHALNVENYETFIQITKDELEQRVAELFT